MSASAPSLVARAMVAANDTAHSVQAGSPTVGYVAPPVLVPADAYHGHAATAPETYNGLRPVVVPLERRFSSAARKASRTCADIDPRLCWDCIRLRRSQRDEPIRVG